MRACVDTTTIEQPDNTRSGIRVPVAEACHPPGRDRLHNGPADI